MNFLHSFHSRYIFKYFDILSEFIFLAFFLHENSGELIFKQFFLCLVKAFSEDWKGNLASRFGERSTGCRNVRKRFIVCGNRTEGAS